MDTSWGLGYGVNIVDIDSSVGFYAPSPGVFAYLWAIIAAEGGLSIAQGTGLLQGSAVRERFAAAVYRPQGGLLRL